MIGGHKICSIFFSIFTAASLNAMIVRTSTVFMKKFVLTSISSMSLQRWVNAVKALRMPNIAFGCSQEASQSKVVQKLKEVLGREKPRFVVCIPGRSQTEQEILKNMVTLELCNDDKNIVFKHNSSQYSLKDFVHALSSHSALNTMPVFLLNRAVYWSNYGRLDKLVELVKDIPIEQSCIFFAYKEGNNENLSLNRYNQDNNEPKILVLDFEHPTDEWITAIVEEGLSKTEFWGDNGITADEIKDNLLTQFKPSLSAGEIEMVIEKFPDHYKKCNLYQYKGKKPDEVNYIRKGRKKYIKFLIEQSNMGAQNHWVWKDENASKKVFNNLYSGSKGKKSPGYLKRLKETIRYTEGYPIPPRQDWKKSGGPLLELLIDMNSGNREDVAGPDWWERCLDELELMYVCVRWWKEKKHIPLEVEEGPS
jgi:hypothetical protein